MKNRLFVLLFTIAVFIVGGLLYIYNPETIEYKKEDKTTTVQNASSTPIMEEGTIDDTMMIKSGNDDRYNH